MLVLAAVAAVVVVIVRGRSLLLVKVRRMLVFVCVLHVRAVVVLLAVSVSAVVVVVVLSEVVTRCRTGGGALLAAGRGNLVLVRGMSAGVAVLVVVRLLAGRVRVVALLDLDHVQVSHVVVAQVLVVRVHQLDDPQAEVGQKILEALEVQQALVAVAAEQLLDVVLLLLLRGVLVRVLRVWDVRRLGDLQVAVVVAVVGVVVVGVAVVVVVVVAVVVVVVVPVVLVPLAIALGALVEEEGEHAQEAELGVQQDSHGPLTSGALQPHKQHKQTHNQTRW